MGIRSGLVVSAFPCRAFALFFGPLSPKIKKRVRLAFVSLFLAGLVVQIGWMAAPRLLWVETAAPAPAGAVVVLGGEGWTRPHRAAEVFRETQSALVIVSGDGDCQDVRRQLEARAVPRDKILTECESKSTFENARFSVKLLRERQVTNVVIVTSWYHSRRALACFRAAAPEMTFYSRPTPVLAAKSRWADIIERKCILQEYVKILYYSIWHGISPAIG